MFRNLLVNVDGSPGAKAALVRAVDIARMSRGRIGLVGVVPSTSRSTWGWLYSLPVPASQLDEQLEDETRRNLDKAERAVPAGVPVTKLVVRGKPAEALVTLACDGLWDGLVVGDRLAGYPWPMTRGATRLLRSSPVPVLIVCGGLNRPASPDALPADDVRISTKRPARQPIGPTRQSGN